MILYIYILLFSYMQLQQHKQDDAMHQEMKEIARTESSSAIETTEKTAVQDDSPQSQFQVSCMFIIIIMINLRKLPLLYINCVYIGQELHCPTAMALFNPAAAIYINNNNTPIPYQNS